MPAKTLWKQHNVPFVSFYQINLVHLLASVYFCTEIFCFSFTWLYFSFILLFVKLIDLVASFASIIYLTL